jgi:hypothetical protein
VSDERGEDQPGWAAPAVPPREPSPWDTLAVPPPSTGGTQPTVPAGAAPAVPPPQDAAGAPRAKRGKGWLVVLLVALGGILAMAIAGTVLFATRTVPPYNGADDFLSAVKRGDDTAAQNDLCSADTGDSQHAIQIVRDTMSGASGVSANAFGVDRSDDTARVDFSVTSGSTTSQSYVLPMVKEGGSWKACPL